MISQLEPRLGTARKVFHRRDSIPLPKNQLWRLEEGVVRTFSWTDEGTLITLGLWGPGEVFGAPLTSVDPYRAECLTVVKAVLLNQQQWQQDAQLLVNHIQQVSELLEIVRYGQAEVVLLRLLVWISRRFGHENQQGRHIDLQITHQELAELSGLTRVTVTRLLSLYEKRGLIHRKQRQIVVLPESQPFWHYEI